MLKDSKNKFRYERSKSGEVYPRHSNKVNLDCEESAKKQSMKYDYRKSHIDPKDKFFFDFGKFNRFLDSNIGKKWDDVYSEITEYAKRHPEQNIINHIKYYIEENCILINGEVFDSKGEFNLSSQESYAWRAYYVHPTTKTLCKKPLHKKMKRANNSSKIYELQKSYYYYCPDTENWYRLHMVEIDEKPAGKIWKDANFGYFSLDEKKWTPYRSSYDQAAKKCARTYRKSPSGKFWYCSKRESANSKEIKKIKEKYSL